jgi:hypothetical protein
MKLDRLEHRFVDAVPQDIEHGVLYVSIRYRTAVHRCGCGCGNNVVTPIRPPRWHLTFDGDTVTLWPSVGNWQFPCHSHYWVKNNAIHWGRPWTDEQIAAGRARDAADMRLYYELEPPTLAVCTRADGSSPSIQRSSAAACPRPARPSVPTSERSKPT